MSKNLKRKAQKEDVKEEEVVEDKIQSPVKLVPTTEQQPQTPLLKVQSGELNSIEKISKKVKSSLPYDVIVYNNLDPQRMKSMRTKFIEPTPNGERTFKRENLVPLANIYKAYKGLAEITKKTPLFFSRYLSEKYKCNVFLKRDDLQNVRSFKIRGAYNKIMSLTQQQRDSGVVCASAGNHAQGVAFTCNRLEIKGTIFMPVNAPTVKVNSVRMFGGPYITIKQFGNTFDECFRAAKKYNDEHGTTYVHPYDDNKIIEGQATCAVEVLEDWNQAKYGSVDYAFVPIGGGGLCAGVSAYFSQLSPETQLIGVEPLGSPSMLQALIKNECTPLKSVNPFIDGAAVGMPGVNTHRVLRETLNEIVLIPEGHCCMSLLDLFQNEGICCEPAGALAVSALDFYVEDVKDKNVVLFITGSNNDLTRMTDIETMSDMYLGKRYYLLINFTQKQGALKIFLTEILSEEDEVITIDYTKGTMQLGPALVGLKCPSMENFERIAQKLSNYNLWFKLLTPDDEIFKLML